MLGPIGMQELIIIFVIALIVFGPRKLPQLGKSLGRSIAEFKRASNELRSTLEQEIRVEETRKEIMDPIETISNEAKAAVKNATSLAEADLNADVDSATTSPEPVKPETDNPVSAAVPAVEDPSSTTTAEAHETKA